MVRKLFHKVFCLFGICCMAIPLLAQQSVADMPTPQVANLFQYKEVETSLYSGKIGITIPIYTLPDPDFPLEISLGYNSDGFKPRKHSGYVGYNWYLNVGGCIMREVKEFPDEKAISWDNGVKQYGMLYALRTGRVSADCSEGIFNMTEDCVYRVYEGIDTTYFLAKSLSIGVDYQPDIFHFDFCGHHGSFMIDNAGVPTIISGDFVDIDISGLEGRDCGEGAKVTKPTPHVYSTITIKTIDGYEYRFGGDQTSVEYTVPLKSGQFWAESVDPTINTWYLKQITAPNNRQIHFYYKPLNIDGGLWQFDEYNLYPKSQEDRKDKGVKHYEAYSCTKQCIIDSISIRGKYPIRIEFSNSRALYRKYNSSRCSACESNYKLDSIMVKQGDQVLHRAALSYDYRTDSSKQNYWRFLSSVWKSDEGTYRMEYRHIGAYPFIDIPIDPYNSKDEDVYGYWKKAIDPAHGLLTQLVYPSGGKQVFEYEKHQYDIKQEYKINGYTSVELVNNREHGNIGGVRIASVEVYDGNKLVEKRSYNYNSSGVYFQRLGIKRTDGTDVIPASGCSYSRLETHIGYSKVTEKIQKFPSGEEYSTEYTFNTQRPYNSVSDATINVRRDSNHDKSLEVFGSTVLCYGSMLCKFGKLLSKVCKDNNGNIVAIYTYDYNGIGRGLDILSPQSKFVYGRSKEIIIFSTINATSVARKLQIYPDVVNQECITQVTQGLLGVTKTIDYQYDSKQRVVQEVIRNSDGKEYFTSYRYPDEFSNIKVANSMVSNPIWCWQYLTQKHTINSPIEKLSGFYENQHKYITAGQIFVHYMENLTMHPMDSLPMIDRDSTIYMRQSAIDKLYEWKVVEKRLQISAPITDYEDIAATSLIGAKYDSRFVTSATYTYEKDWTKIKKVEPVGEPTTTYTWDDIFVSTIMKGKQKYVYTYFPYIGIKSVTDPRGITTYYTYDAAGRLNEVYQIIDGKKCVIQSYYYHVADE